MSEINLEILKNASDTTNDRDLCKAIRLNLSNLCIKSNLNKKILKEISSINKLIKENCPLAQFINLNHNEIRKIENLEPSKLPNLKILNLGFNNIK